MGKALIGLGVKDDFLLYGEGKRKFLAIIVLMLCLRCCFYCFCYLFFLELLICFHDIPVFLSVFLFVFLCVCLSVYLSLCMFICLFTCLFHCLSFLSMYLSFFGLSTYCLLLSVNLSFRLSVFLSL